MFGKTYFGDVYLDLEIKRENLLQKYIRWLKNNHPAEWSSMLQQRKNLREKEMEMRVKTDLERERQEEVAKKLEDSMKKSGML